MGPIPLRVTSADASSFADVFVFFAFAAMAVVLFVFDSPAVDYRWVALGGVLPLVEAVTLRPLIFHTLLGSVLLLAIVMALTVGRRLVRRRWLGVPIGTFVFLIVAGVWARTELFWWPFAGLDGIAERPLPEYDRPLAVLLGLELAAIAAAVLLARRLGLDEPANRQAFVRTGRVPSDRLR